MKRIRRITEKIDVYINEAIKKINMADKAKFQEFFQKSPKKRMSFISTTFSKDYNKEEREVFYIPLRNGFQFEYDLDFDPEFSELLDDLSAAYQMTGKSSMERPINLATYTVTYRR